MAQKPTEEFKEIANEFGEKHIKVNNMGYPGIISGKAYVLRAETHQPEPSEPLEPHEIAGEIKKFEEARRRVIAEYQKKISQTSTLPVEINDSVESMLEGDLQIVELMNLPGSKVLNAINAGKTAHKAVYDYLNGYIKIFSQISDPDSPLYDPNSPSFGKHEDYEHMLQSFQGAINPALRVTKVADAPDGSIIIARSIPVGELIQFRKADGKGTRIDGMINSTGSDKDHVNIMARSSKITVAIIPAEDLHNIRTDDEIIIDGPNNKIIQNPSPKTIEKYESDIKVQDAADRALLEKSQKIRHPKTTDGTTIKVSANTGYSDEMGAVKIVNAPRIGLHRTEIGVLARAGNDRIDEDKWYDIFSHILHESERSAVTFRTIDFEGDKIGHAEMNDEAKQDMIRDQMRAALRLSQNKPTNQKVHIMFPMIRTPGEYKRLQKKMDEQAEDLNINSIHCGIMVETPSIVRELGKIDPAFLSVGTNDFIPALLGYDRYHKDSDKIYDPTNPAVIEALEEIVTHRTSRREVSVCGDMATDPRYLAILIGTGFQHISCGVSRVPMMKELIKRIDTAKAFDLVEALKNADGREERNALLDDFNSKYLGLKENRTFNQNWEKPSTPDIAPESP